MRLSGITLFLILFQAITTPAQEEKRPLPNNNTNTIQGDTESRAFSDREEGERDAELEEPLSALEELINQYNSGQEVRVTKEEYKEILFDEFSKDFATFSITESEKLVLQGIINQFVDSKLGETFDLQEILSDFDSPNFRDALLKGMNLKEEL